MYALSVQQIKAGRALLEWSQEDLARASDLSISTIRNVEMGYVPRIATLQDIYRTMEHAGLEFTEGQGVKNRDNEITVYRGSDSCDRFFDALRQRLGKYATELLVLVRSQHDLQQACGMPLRNNAERLERLTELAAIKCLFADEAVPAAAMGAGFEQRMVPRYAIGPATCFVFGDSYAHILPQGHLNFLIAVYDIPAVAADYRQEFLSQWQHGRPIPAGLNA